MTVLKAGDRVIVARLEATVTYASNEASRDYVNLTYIDIDGDEQVMNWVPADEVDRDPSGPIQVGDQLTAAELSERGATIGTLITDADPEITPYYFALTTEGWINTNNGEFVADNAELTEWAIPGLGYRFTVEFVPAVTSE